MMEARRAVSMLEERELAANGPVAAAAEMSRPAVKAREEDVPERMMARVVGDVER